MHNYQFYARRLLRYEFYPFFLECSKRETDVYRKKHFELLAFEKGGAIIQDSNHEFVYVTGNRNFKIPNIYSDEERDKLCKLIWEEDTDFFAWKKKSKSVSALGET